MALLAALLVALPAQADAPVQRQVLERAEVLRLGATQGPLVRPVEAARRAASSLPERTTPLLQPPMLTLTGGARRTGTGTGAELSASLEQAVPLHGLRSAQADVAQAVVATTEADRQRARLDGAARAAAAWVTALEAEEVLRLRREATTAAEELARLAAARVREGVAQPLEEAQARAEVGAARAAGIDAEGALVEALAELRYATGLPSTQAVDPVGDLYAGGGAPLHEAAGATAKPSAGEEHPAVRWAEARAALAESERKLARVTLGPQFTVGVTALREGDGEQVYTAHVGVPIPFFRPSRFDEARLGVSAAQAGATVAVTRATVARERCLALHDREHYRELRDTLRHDALAPSEEAVRIARARYEHGEQELTPLLLAGQRLISVRERLAHAAAEVMRADLRAALATGTLLDEIPSP